MDLLSLHGFRGMTVAGGMTGMTVAGRDVMPEMNKVLTLSFTPTWHQQKAAQTLNYLADLMKQQPGEMEQTWAWEMLRFG